MVGRESREIYPYLALSEFVTNPYRYPRGRLHFVGGALSGAAHGVVRRPMTMFRPRRLGDRNRPRELWDEF
jgi:hypothetical protein